MAPTLQGMATLKYVARIMGELPEVAEGEHHGHATWSVCGKGIAWLRPFSKADLKRFGDQATPVEPIRAVNTKDLHEKEGVLAGGVNGVFTIQHFTNYPAVLVELGVISERDLRNLLVDAWLAVAPSGWSRGSTAEPSQQRRLAHRYTTSTQAPKLGVPPDC